METLLDLVGLDCIKGYLAIGTFLLGICACGYYTRPITNYEKRHLYNLITDNLKKNK